jgi:hypothetical protein
LSPAVRAAINPATRAVDASTWIKAQLAKRTAYVRALAPTLLGVPEEQAVRMTADGIQQAILAAS